MLISCLDNAQGRHQGISTLLTGNVPVKSVSTTESIPGGALKYST